MGKAGPGFEWHHVIEQHASNIAKFGNEAIQNTANIVRIDVATHRKISAFFAAKNPAITGAANLTVRAWISTQPLQVQRDFGLMVLKMFNGK